MAFEVQLEAFDGPLHVLLDLIQTQELPITDVSLAQVTELYLEYMQTHDVPVSELADFLVVAAKLLLIKSQAILPDKTELEEESSSNLALQLQLYKEFVLASEQIQDRFDDLAWSFARQAPDVIEANKETLLSNVSVNDLQGSFTRLLKSLEPLFQLQTTAMERVVSVQERLQEIRESILSRTKMTFRQLTFVATSKVDVVISFLALLQLVKQQTVNVVQSGVFEDIEIKHVD